MDCEETETKECLTAQQAQASRKAEKLNKIWVSLVILLGLTSAALAVLLTFSISNPGIITGCSDSLVQCYQPCKIQPDCEELNWKAKENSP